MYISATMVLSRSCIEYAMILPHRIFAIYSSTIAYTEKDEKY